MKVLSRCCRKQGKEILKLQPGGQALGAALVGSAQALDVLWAGQVMCGGCGLVGRSGTLGATQSVDWLCWYFVCMLLFFSNQEAGFGISVSFLGSGGSYKVRVGKGHGGQNPACLQA